MRFLSKSFVGLTATLAFHAHLPTKIPKRGPMIVSVHGHFTWGGEGQAIVMCVNPEFLNGKFNYSPPEVTQKLTADF